MELQQKYEKLLAFVRSIANELPSDPTDGPTPSGFPEEATRLIREISDIHFVCRLCGKKYKGFHQC
jgi:hypothetical protein